MRVAGDVDGLRATDRADDLRDRLDKAQRVPVVFRCNPGLLLNAANQIRQGKAQLHPFLIVDPPGDGNGLVADAARNIDVIEGKLQDLPDLIFIDAAGDGRHIDDLDAGLADGLDRLQFVFQQLAAARLLVYVVVHAVELQVDRMQARFGGTHGEIRIRKLDPVRGHLDVAEAHLLGAAQDLEEVGVDGRFPARKLDQTAGHRLLVPIEPQHVHDLFFARLVDFSRDIGVGKADGTGQIAAIGQIDVAQSCVTGVALADAAIPGADFALGIRVGQPFAVAEFPLFCLQVEFDIRPVQVLVVPVLRASLIHVDLAVFRKQPGHDHLAAVRIRTDRFNVLGQAFGNVVGRHTAVGRAHRLPGNFLIHCRHVWTDLHFRYSSGKWSRISKSL